MYFNTYTISNARIHQVLHMSPQLQEHLPRVKQDVSLTREAKANLLLHKNESALCLSTQSGVRLSAL